MTNNKNWKYVKDSVVNIFIVWNMHFLLWLQETWSQVKEKTQGDEFYAILWSHVYVYMLVLCHPLEEVGSKEPGAHWWSLRAKLQGSIFED